MKKRFALQKFTFESFMNIMRNIHPNTLYNSRNVIHVNKLSKLSFLIQIKLLTGQAVIEELLYADIIYT